MSSFKRLGRTAPTPVPGLLLITTLAVLVHGYHLGVDDAAIYVPAIKRAADPTLYPFGSEFFMSHAHLSFFGDVVGKPAHLIGMPPDAAIFLWHVGSIFLLLLASWRLLSACFRNGYARWSGVALLAGVLSVPVAGTALAIMDPYLTARSLSTPAVLFAISCFVSRRPKRALAWLFAAALVHPQMSAYGAVFLGFLAWYGRFGAPAPAAVPAGMLAFSTLPFLFEFQPARGAAREALFSRTYFFVANWTWYEWAGIWVPLALLWLLSSANPKGATPAFRRVARALVPFGLLFTAAGFALAMSPRLENYARLQPMRAFHLVYIVFFILLGGLLGEYALQRRAWRWLAVFAPLAASMWFLQQHDFPSSLHVEWPGLASQNAWTSAFFWVRQNTPHDAVFALDPDYMLRPGEDEHGFRAVAERSVLADNVKDSGAVSLFPQLAGEWKSQVNAQSGWKTFGLAEFGTLAKEYPVTWIVTRAHPAGLVCPYENPEVAVCRIAGSRWFAKITPALR